MGNSVGKPADFTIFLILLYSSSPILPKTKESLDAHIIPRPTAWPWVKPFKAIDDSKACPKVWPKLSKALSPFSLSSLETIEDLIRDESYMMLIRSLSSAIEPLVILCSNSSKRDLSAIKECLMISAKPSEISDLPKLDSKSMSIKTKFGW